METEERQEKTTQESEKSDRSNEPVAKTKEDLQREQKEDEQRRRKERLEEEEKKRKERLEESQRERKVRMEEAQRERQRLAEEARIDRLDRRSLMESMASSESAEDSRWKERRRKRREDSDSRLLITCDDNQDSQDPLERSDKTPGLYRQGCIDIFIIAVYPISIAIENLFMLSYVIVECDQITLKQLIRSGRYDKTSHRVTSLHTERNNSVHWKVLVQ